MAGTKVNKNFVVLLVTGIVTIVVGLGALGAFAILRSGSRNVSKGDAAMTAGDYKSAQQYYSRAVNKDRGNVEWLTKWKQALEKWVPENEAEYRKAYQNYYLGVLRTIAVVQNRDPKAQRQFLDELDGHYRGGGGGVEPMKVLLRDVDDRIKQLPQDDTETKKLLRYRGLARIEIMDRQPIPDDERAMCLKDLQTAAEADPSDWESRTAIARWYTNEAERLASSRRDADATAAREKALAELESFLATQPDQPEATVMQMMLRQGFQASKVTTLQERVELMKNFRPMAQEVMDKLLKVDAANLRPPLLWQTASRVRPILGTEGATQSLALVERALAHSPNDPGLLMLAAEMTYESGDLKNTFDRFQKVADLKDVPVSRIGLNLPGYRRTAIARQIDTALDMWRKAKDDAARDEAMKLAQSYREKLKLIVDASSEGELKLRDAYIAVATGKLQEAIRLLSEIRSSAASSDDHRVLMPLADALQRTGSKGDAAQIYDRLIEKGYVDAGVLAAAGLVHLDLQNIAKANEYFQKAVVLDPENKSLQTLSSRTSQMESVVKGETANIEDPIVKGIMKASKATADGDVRTARALYEQLYKDHSDDQRVVSYYVRYLMQEDNVARANEVLDKAIAAQPNERLWPRMKISVNTPDPDEAALLLIEDAQITPVEKLIQRYTIYARQGKVDKVDEVVAEAVKLAPDDPQVIEMQFLRSIADIMRFKAPTDAPKRQAAEAAAQAVLTKAAAKNLDQLGGELYRARLLMAQEKYRDAALVTKQAVEKVPFLPNAWRLLGLAYLESGQVNEGLNAYQKALDGRPSDAGIAKDYARALVKVNRGKDALALINPDTGVLRFGENAGDQDLVDMWLSLEATEGGEAGVAKAIDRRRILFGRSAENLPNGVALARLLISSGQFPEARKVLDAIEKNPKARSGLATRLNADWFAAQGKVEEGEKVFKDFLAGLGDKTTVRNWLEYSEWQLENQRPAPAMEAMEQARKFQTSMHEADRTLGDFLFNGYTRLRDNSDKARALGQPEVAEQAGKTAKEFLERAEQVYSAVIDADADTPEQGYPVLKRLVETQIRLEKFDAASATLDKLAKVSTSDSRLDQDLQYLLLRATITEKKGNPREARKLYDTAVEKHPGEPRAYLARAILNAKDDSLFPDVIADLTQVTRMQPGNGMAWNMLFIMYEKRGQVDQAFAIINKAVEANPSDESLNQLYIERLKRYGRSEEALAHTIRMVMRDRRNDPVWVNEAAMQALKLEKWREAADMFKIQLENPSQQNVNTKALYLHALLMRLNPLPDKIEVGKLYEDIKSDQKTSGTLASYMLRARAEAFLNNTTEAMKLATEGYNLAKDSRALYGWYNDAMNMILVSFKKGNAYYRDLPDGVRLAQKEVFNRFRDARKPMPPLLQVMEVPFRQAAGEPLSKLVGELEPFVQELKDDPLGLTEVYRALNQLYYAMEQWEKSLDACKKGLEINPKDVEFNNNAAYTLSKYMNKHEEALPFAQKAAATAGKASPVLDTLGQIYFQLKKYDEAVKNLQLAIDNARGPDELLAANIHMAQTCVAMKNLPAARRAYDKAKEAAAKMPDASRQAFKADLDSLSKMVE